MLIKNASTTGKHDWRIILGYQQNSGYHDTYGGSVEQGSTSLMDKAARELHEKTGTYSTFEDAKNRLSYITPQAYKNSSKNTLFYILRDDSASAQAVSKQILNLFNTFTSHNTHF